MVSDRNLRVYLDGRECGELTQTAAGNLTFAYHPDYQRAPGATPISLSMPLAAATHRKKVVLPFLQGLLPDSEMALTAMARRFSVSPNNPFALMEHIGHEVAGALQILGPGQPSTDATGSRAAVQQ